MVFASTLAVLALASHPQNETNKSTALRGLPISFGKGLYGKYLVQRPAGGKFSIISDYYS